MQNGVLEMLTSSRFDPLVRDWSLDFAAPADDHFEVAPELENMVLWEAAVASFWGRIAGVHGLHS